MAVIDVRNLRKSYGDREAVSGVTFSVEAGEIFGIIGRNGAGKTTTVECVSGLRERDSGDVSVLGLDPRRHREQIVRNVGVQLQESMLQDRITVAEALGLFASFYPRPDDPARLIAELGLEKVRDTAYTKLSGGQKQRLSIALALIGAPRVAILDELTTGLDPQARRETWQLISRVRERGVTILLVTHFMDEAERLCDRIAVIHKGRVTALGSPAELTAQVATGQVLRLRTAAPADIAALTALTEVVSVQDDGGELTITGTGDALPAVITELSRQQLIPIGLRVEQASLEDAFLTLTGEPA
jgi:ABC-2 type transport system ATP-binding protein